MKDTMIVASYLNQISIPLEEIKMSYSINDEYIDNLINNIIPQLRVNAYKYIDETLHTGSIEDFKIFLKLEEIKIK